VDSVAPKMSRRDVLAVGGALALGSAGVHASDSRQKGQPKRKRLKDLLAKHEPETYSGDDLRYIGMPVGGLFAGTVYLGGDGQLWNWDVFNVGRLGCVERDSTVFMGDTLTAMGGANYVDPVRQQSPFRQGWRLIFESGGDRAVRFGEVRFRGEYPIGRVEYSQADADLQMTLEAFSPFVPLDAESSSFPATTLTFRVSNTGQDPIVVRLQYDVENPILVGTKATRDDAVLAGTATSTRGISFSASQKPPIGQGRPTLVFEDWRDGVYGSWTTTGTAFGEGPQRVAAMPAYMGRIEAGTEFVANSHQTRNGEDVAEGDAHVGRLRSPAFTISRDFINLRVGGGSHKGKTCVNLVVDDRVVRSVTGRSSNVMRWETLSVSSLQGENATLEVVDDATGGWGNIALGEVEFSDEPKGWPKLEDLGDFGTFCAEFVGGATESTADERSGRVSKRLTIAPGEVVEATLVIAWHFPNCAPGMPGNRHWYAKRWSDASAVAQDLIARWPALQATTRAWNRCWYDSTLPAWFLDRTFVNTSVLATTTCFRFEDGRYYFMEGVGCCPGTCTHVWGYAQAVGRVFPEIERYLRRAIDFGIAYHGETGAIDYRAEYHRAVATDGQASCILRAYREHLGSGDDTFLRSIWPQVKGAMGHLISQDPDKDGILDGAQYNTLDTAWYGKIAWISSLYVAALRASEAMATVVEDEAFAHECRQMAERGSKRLVQELFNGEYFVNKADDAHPEANNTRDGCHIDQVYGQSWAMQVGLPRVIPVAETKAALAALMEHNFFDDVWEYRRKMKDIPGGRWYATPKEAGMVMCSFPKGGAARAIGRGSDAWAVGYFNECMSGFEYQVASHMIAEGMLEQGLTLVRAIHERYHASKRNPYNEVECSDHYGRAAASYGAFVAICGLRLNGPRGTMTIEPKTPGRRFRSAFIDEEGWGSVDRASSGVTTRNYHFRDGRLVEPRTKTSSSLG